MFEFQRYIYSDYQFGNIVVMYSYIILHAVPRPRAGQLSYGRRLIVGVVPGVLYAGVKGHLLRLTFEGCDLEFVLTWLIKKAVVREGIYMPAGCGIEGEAVRGCCDADDTCVSVCNTFVSICMCVFVCLSVCVCVCDVV